MFMVNIQLKNEDMVLDFKSIHVLKFTLWKIWYAALPIFPIILTTIVIYFNFVVRAQCISILDNILKFNNVDILPFRWMDKKVNQNLGGFKILEIIFYP